MLPGFDPMLLLVLNLAGTFAFGLSGSMAGVRERLDLFGVAVLAVVVGLAGGITRDLLIGVPPETLRDILVRQTPSCSERGFMRSRH